MGNAAAAARKRGLTVDFRCGSVLDAAFMEGPPVDFVYDSGLFHHLAPHRRLTYLQLLDHRLKPGAYFGLTCFAWDTGVAFTREKLVHLFRPCFDILEIEKYREGVAGTLPDSGFLWACLFRKR